MTFSSKLFVTLIAMFVTVSIAFVLSATDVAYAGTMYENSAPITEMQPKGTQVSQTSNLPFVSGETYLQRLQRKYSKPCNCPVSLPPTSGQVDTLESFSIIASDMMYIIWSNVFGTN